VDAASGACAPTDEPVALSSERPGYRGPRRRFARSSLRGFGDTPPISRRGPGAPRIARRRALVPAIGRGGPPVVEQQHVMHHSPRSVQAGLRPRAGPALARPRQLSCGRPSRPVRRLYAPRQFDDATTVGRRGAGAGSSPRAWVHEHRRSPAVDGARCAALATVSLRSAEASAKVRFRWNFAGQSRIDNGPGKRPTVSGRTSPVLRPGGAVSAQVGTSCRQGRVSRGHRGCPGRKDAAVRVAAYCRWLGDRREPGRRALHRPARPPRLPRRPVPARSSDPGRRAPSCLIIAVGRRGAWHALLDSPSRQQAHPSLVRCRVRARRVPMRASLTIGRQ